MPAPAPQDHAPAGALDLIAEGALWAMALVLIAQTFLGFVAPTVLDALLELWVYRRTGACGPVCDLAYTSLLPWLVFVAMHLLQARLLRRGGAFPYSTGQIVLMALLPSYNLHGTVALFSAEADELERRGGGRSLGLELRAASALASGLAVALTLCWLRMMHPVLTESRPVMARPFPPSRPVVVLAVWLLLVRLYVLARLQLAQRHVRTSSAAPPVAFRHAAGLPGATVAVGIAALAVLAGALAFPPLAAVSVGAEPQQAPATAAAGPTTVVDPQGLRPRPAAATELAPPRPAEPPRLPADHLMGGRTLEEWRARLGTLRARTDEEGRQLYELTRARAERNGLKVTEGEGAVEVNAPPELIESALRGTTR
jgi:hypothetical protein